MFAILTYFCWAFYDRSLLSPYPQAKARRVIYFACAIAMALAILMLAGNGLHLVDHLAFPKIVYCGEATGLMAFGVSWLTASRTVPGLTHPSERFAPWRAVNPLD